MGQYYKPTIQAIKYDENRKEVRKHFAIYTHDLNYGLKLCENSDKNSEVVRLVTNLMYELNKQDWATQLVWLGDYANPSFGVEPNLYGSLQYSNVKFRKENGVIVSAIIEGFDGVIDMTQDHHYLVNHDRNEYINTSENVGAYSQLALLTADGNGKGGGDYWGKNWRDVGLWRYHEISVMDKERFYEYLKERSRFQSQTTHYKWVNGDYHFDEIY
jgi:hypothetical protein